MITLQQVLADIQSLSDTFVVEVENFESIHNHSAFARISSPDRSKRKDKNTVATSKKQTSTISDSR